jgi:hypothetical protein
MSRLAALRLLVAAAAISAVAACASPTAPTSPRRAAVSQSNTVTDSTCRSGWTQGQGYTCP